VKKDETLGKRYVAFKAPDRIAWELYMAWGPAASRALSNKRLKLAGPCYWENRRFVGEARCCGAFRRPPQARSLSAIRWADLEHDLCPH